MKTQVRYEKSDFIDYSLYFFYTWAVYDNEFCWLWDEDKLTYEDAILKYPKTEFCWVLID